MEIPSPLIKAVNKVIELNISIYDEVILEIYARNNKNQIECLLSWVAYDSPSRELEIWWDWLRDVGREEQLKLFSRKEIIQCKKMPEGDIFEFAQIKSTDIDYILDFLIDYYKYFNPLVDINELCVDIHFNTAMNEEGQVDLAQAGFTFSFFPDGTDSGKEQFERCITFLNQKRELENEYE